MLRVLVIAGEGSLGRQVAERLLRGGYDAIELPRDDLDVLDRKGSRRAIHRARPDVVVDCSLAQGARGELVRAASHVALAARDAGAYGLHLSSVEVFDGQAGLPYLESDTPRPATASGTAQLESEVAVADGNHRHAIVRLGSLFGQGAGDVADALLAQSSHSDRVVVDSTTTIAPTSSAHLADVIAWLVPRRAYGVFHVPGGGSCTELQLARTLLRMTGSRARAVAAEPAEGEQPARNMTLASCRGVAACPDWRIALQAHLQARREAAEEPKGIHT